MNAAILAFIALAEIQNGIPKGLLLAVCTVESGLDPYVVVERDGLGGRSSFGLCQVQHRTSKQFFPRVGAKELLSPSINARVAAAYLRAHFDRYKRWDRAVVAYNRGSSTGGRNRYLDRVEKEWRINGGYKKNYARLSPRSSRGTYNANGSDSVLRQDYTRSD